LLGAQGQIDFAFIAMDLDKAILRLQHDLPAFIILIDKHHGDNVETAPE
jgi:hypothetical protein